jgi:peptide deformylase
MPEITIVTDDELLSFGSISVGPKENIDELIEKMKQVLRDHPEGVGLSAPQIGVYKRVIVVRLPGDPKTKTETVYYTFVNPIILDKDRCFIFRREGCLSFPGQFISTLRYRRVTVKDDYNLNESGEKMTRIFSGMMAVVLQHEVDHLNGVTIFDRMKKEIGRNEKCPCGSGKKYKKCCISEE